MSTSAVAAPIPSQAEPDPAARLLAGLARAVAAKGYAATTIADIVAEAAVSRRTFYEHFADKPACFMALYERVSAQGLAVLGDALDPARPWDTQLDDALTAYFEWMAADLSLTRALFIEILALGPAGLAARRRAQDRIASFILATVERGGLRRMPLARAQAVAIIGAIHEVVLERLEADDAEGVRRLAPVSGDLVRRLISA